MPRLTNNTQKRFATDVGGYALSVSQIRSFFGDVPYSRLFQCEVNHRHAIGRELDLTGRAHVQANTNHSSGTTRISKISQRGFMQKH